MKTKTAELIYAGRRYVNGTMMQCFYPINSEEPIWFKSVKGVWVGSSYAAEVKGKDGLALARHPDLVRSGAAPEGKVDAWGAEDAAAVATRDRLKAAKEYQRDTALNKLIDGLKPFVGGMSFMKMRALSEHIVERLQEEHVADMNRQLAKALKQVRKKK